MLTFWMKVPPTDLNKNILSIEHYYYVVGFEKVDCSFLKQGFGFYYSDDVGRIKVDTELLSKGYKVRSINRI